MAVNDAFVMAAWGKDQGVGGKVAMLADGSAAFTKALGLELDLVGRGMGVRSQRFALVAQDGKVTHLGRRAAGRLRGQQGRGDPGQPLILRPIACGAAKGATSLLPPAFCCHARSDDWR